MTTVWMKRVDDENGDLIDLLLYHEACAPMEADSWPVYESEYCEYCDECSEVVTVGMNCDCDRCAPYVCSIPLIPTN